MIESAFNTSFQVDSGEIGRFHNSEWDYTCLPGPQSQNKETLLIALSYRSFVTEKSSYGFNKTDFCGKELKS